MYSNEIWSIGFDSSVRRALKRFTKKDARKVFAVFDELSVNPYSGDIEKLKGEENKWRRRVGAYRIFYFDERGARGSVLIHTASESKSNYRSTPPPSGGCLHEPACRQAAKDEFLHYP